MTRRSSHGTWASPPCWPIPSWSRSSSQSCIHSPISSRRQTSRRVAASSIDTGSWNTSYSPARSSREPLNVQDSQSSPHYINAMKPTASTTRRSSRRPSILRKATRSGSQTGTTSAQKSQNTPTRDDTSPKSYSTHCVTSTHSGEAARF